MNSEASAELRRLCEASPTRTLRPEAVVEAAKRDDNPLHRYFTWDDGEAAQAYRLMQARALIRVAVNVIEETSEPVRAYVSLSTDRKSGVGYRATADVMSDADLLMQLLADAKAELAAFQRKYTRLREAGELLPIFKAIEVLEGCAPPARRSRSAELSRANRT